MLFVKRSIGSVFLAVVILVPILASAFSLTPYRRGPVPIPSNYITAVAVDDAGTVWIGTGDKGLVTRSAKDEWKTATEAEGFTGQEVSDIAFWSGKVLVGTKKGLFIKEQGGDKWTHLFEVADGKLTKPVLAPAGKELWAGALGPRGGLFRLKADGAWERLSGPQGEPMNDTTALKVVGETVWIGTLNHGLFRYRNGEWGHYGLDRGLPHIYVSDLDWDGENLWMAFSQVGVARMEGDTFKLYTEEDGLPSRFCRRILTGPNTGDVWVGTTKAGLARFDGSQWTTYAREDGLVGESVFDIAKGDKGVWVATNGGLFYLVP